MEELSMLVRLSLVMLLVCHIALSRDARAECSCVAVAGDVAASVQAEVAKADGLYARGDFSGALAIYAKAYASSKDAALLYAQGMANWQLGASAKAKEMFQAYLATGGSLVYKDRAEAGIAGLGAGVTATAAAVGGGVKGVAGVGGGLVGSASGAVEGGVGAGADFAGGVRTDVQTKTKVGKKAGIVLGVIAIAAIGVVGIHSISAGISDNISLDPKFDLGLGVAGVAVGISAIYVAGLTATTAAAPRCVATLPTRTPLVAPMALPGGGGLAAAMAF